MSGGLNQWPLLEGLELALLVEVQRIARDVGPLGRVALNGGWVLLAVGTMNLAQGSSLVGVSVSPNLVLAILAVALGVASATSFKKILDFRIRR